MSTLGRSPRGSTLGIRTVGRWLIGLTVVLFATPALSDILATKHNFSASGTGEIRVRGARRVCIFCHTKRNFMARAPAWSRLGAGTNYIPYSSSTLSAAPGQPTGSSLLCLSCHDGTTALPARGSPAITQSLRMAMRSMPRDRADLTTDLSDDHPISLYYYDSYAANAERFAHPDSLPDDVELDSNGQVQCISCHDPHEDPFGNFLRVDNSQGELCLSCHIPFGWAKSAHNRPSLMPVQRSSEAPVKGGCDLCHTPHSAAGRSRLLLFHAEENNCFSCHNGLTSAANLEREFQKPYAHKVAGTTNVHDAAEAVVPGERHVECVDCHHPHAARASEVRSRSLEGGEPPAADESIYGAKGVSASGVPILSQRGVGAEYELCFRCHAESLDSGSPVVSRWLIELDTRIEFSPANESYHPVIDRGRNMQVPSLIEPLTHNSIISCSDCHNNDDLAGPSGPHGSSYPAILERQYLTQDATVESPSAYALCYKCHNRNSILADESFSSHRLHIVGGQGDDRAGASCSTCHDPHGSDLARLINFDAEIVSPDGDGRVEYFSYGIGSGGCALSCHGVVHPPLCYDASGTTPCP